jgi:mRNA-degrading endonuclease RelE of RelBE toxin-antitoxin system
MPYLISYLAVGLFLAIASAMHNRFERGKFLIAFSFTVISWPLVIFATPESLFRSERIDRDSDPFSRDLFKEGLTALIEVEGSVLTEEERRRLSRIVKHGGDLITFFGSNSDFEDILVKYWGSNIPPEIYQSHNWALLNLDEQYDLDEEYDWSKPLIERVRPAWYIGFSNEFVKSIAKADHKKQGRILQAIYRISAAPIEVLGKMIKPLTGNHAGLWRCRLGDERLIYYPDMESKKVVLISYASRGKAYQEMLDESALRSRSTGTTNSRAGDERRLLRRVK